jgi:hypothetical protein
MESEDISKYCDCMEEIKRRTHAVHAILSKQYTTPCKATNIEFICLQIRKILELVALASLVANKDEYARHHKKFAEHWRAKAILDSIEKINPRFYPVPGKQVRDPKTGKVTHLDLVKEGFLAQSEFSDVYNSCSEAIHAVNPFGDAVDYRNLEKQIPLWMTKLKTLLNHHQIQLLNEKQMLWVLMQAKTDGKVHAWIFEKVDDPETIEKTKNAQSEP